MRREKARTCRGERREKERTRRKNRSEKEERERKNVQKKEDGKPISRLLKIIGLFCKGGLLKRRYSAKETYDLKDFTHHCLLFV